MYGLKVNYYIDERSDPYLASEAAANYFKDLYSVYKDWFLVLAAYNCGPGNLNKAIRRSGGKTSYWDLMPYLPKETRGYVPAFVAVCYVMQYAEEHNLSAAPLIHLPAETDTVWVQGPVNIQYFGQLLNIPETQMAMLNPQLKQQFIPQSLEPYLLRLPAQSVVEFDRKRDLMFAYLHSLPAISDSTSDSLKHLAMYDSLNHLVLASVPQTITVYHKVSRGQTLGGISAKYGVSVNDLRSWNNLRGNTIRVGQNLRVEKTVKKPDVPVMAQQKPAVRDSSDVEKRVEAERQAIIYTVRPGDTLWSISQRHTGISVADIEKANKLSKDAKLQPGMKLKIEKG